MEVDSFVYTLFLAQVVLASPFADYGSVGTRDGDLVGIEKAVAGGKISVFLGIPYAQPPVGALRFERPLPVKPWSGKRNATKFGSECLQRRGHIPLVSWGSQNESATQEDCLYLNVYTPVLFTRQYSDSDENEHHSGGCTGAKLTDRGLPVMVWIHGGSFRIGSASLADYDGSVLALRKDVVVVTMNYRLGAMGFLYGGNGSSIQGNMGLWDQLEALKWVNRNIAAFGGNPSCVTLFGESVGAVSAGYHALSMAAEGLFNRIIMESGVPNWPTPCQSDADGIKNVRCISGAAGGPNNTVEEAVSYLRSLSDSARIMEAELVCVQPRLFTLMPRIGDDIIPQHPVKSVREGRILAGIEVLLGTNANEGLIIPYIFTPGATVDDNYPFYLEGVSDLAKGFFQGFPPEIQDMIIEHFNNTDLVRMMSDMYGNFILNCPAQYFAENFGDRIPVYLFNIDYVAENNGFPKWAKATHTTEVPFVFGIPFLHPDKHSDTDRAMSEYIMESFTNFAATGTPSSRYVVWPQFRTGETKLVSFLRDAAIEVLDHVVHNDGCEFYRPFIAP